MKWQSMHLNLGEKSKIMQPPGIRSSFSLFSSVAESSRSGSYSP